MQTHYPIHLESHPGIHKKNKTKQNKKKRTCTHYHLKQRKEKKVELNRLADNLIVFFFFVKNFVYWQKVFTVVLWELTCLKSSLFGLHRENETLAKV